MSIAPMEEGNIPISPTHLLKAAIFYKENPSSRFSLSSILNIAEDKTERGRVMRRACLSLGIVHLLMLSLGTAVDIWKEYTL